MDKHEKKGIAIGAAIGAVFGVVTGILFAPKSGKETRQDIKHGAEKIADKAQDEASKIQAEAKELILKAEARLNDVRGKAQENGKKYIDEAKHQMSNVSDILKAVKAGKASDKDLNHAIHGLKEARESLKAFLKK